MMDDDMEDEIVHEIFMAHLHIIWKYVSVTSSSLSQMILPGPGESFKTKMFQPGPFMLLTFLVIISSIIIQTKRGWLQKAVLKIHRSIKLNVTNHTLKDLVSSSFVSDEGLLQFHSGIASVYAIQGRRGTMEDRFSVLQDADVGDGKKLSFFGVFDGHGGQFTAEYVKQNLFLNVVEKIQTLRERKSEDTVSSRNEKKTHKNRNKDSSDSLKYTANIFDRKPSVNGKKEVTPDDLSPLCNKNKDICSSQNGAQDEKRDSECSLEDNQQNNVFEGSCKIEDVSLKKPLSEPHCQVSADSGLNLTDKSQLKEEKGSEEVSEHPRSMKDDPYTDSSLRKKISKSSFKESNTAKDSSARSAVHESSSYVDINSNVNYSKLLTDQILEIDEKVVKFCRNKTDLSGTTAIIAVLDGELLIICNVGDSRAVMGNKKGAAVPLSFDHKPNQLKESRRIKEAGGFITFTGVWRVAGILATSRALGDFPLKEPRKLITAEPDILSFSLKDHKAHFVILASDGLWDVVSNEEAVEFIRDHIHERDFGSHSLVQYAYERGSQDNITVIVLNFDQLSS